MNEQEFQEKHNFETTGQKISNKRVPPEWIFGNRNRYMKRNTDSPWLIDIYTPREEKRKETSNPPFSHIKAEDAEGRERNVGRVMEMRSFVCAKRIS